jgi:hypothetical protein
VGEAKFKEVCYPKIVIGRNSSEAANGDRRKNLCLEGVQKS